MNIKKILQRAEQKLMQNNLIEARELLIKALNVKSLFLGVIFYFIQFFVLL